MKEKTVSESISFRRSVRVYDKNKDIDEKIVKQCIKLSTLAPNSSNLQLWEFYHIISKKICAEISKSCFNQSSAKTSKQFVIPVVRHDLWRNRLKSNIDFIKNNKNDSKNDIISALKYYQEIIPKLYKGFSPIRGYIHSIMMKYRGLFKPTYREVKSSDLRIVAHKSLALASQNFMISMASFGYDTCPMEGFDSKKIKEILNLPKKSEINMVISCGIRTQEGIYGKRFRVPLESVYHKL